jgi:hypothetical protein
MRTPSARLAEKSKMPRVTSLAMLVSTLPALPFGSGLRLRLLVPSGSSTSSRLSHSGLDYDITSLEGRQRVSHLISIDISA